MIHGHRIARNALVLLASQPVSWLLTLGFTVIVARNVGPSEWGEWGLGWWIGLVVRAALDFGINTVLLKEMPRRPEEASRYLGTVLFVRLALSPLLLLLIVGYVSIAQYSPHTRTIIVIVAFSVVLSYITTPVTFGLQAIERMHLTAFGGLLLSGIQTAGAVVLVKFMHSGVIAIALLFVFTSALGLVAQLFWLGRDMRVRPIADLALIRRILREGLPFWASYVIFTVYVWVDGILLSLMAPTQVVGWYNVGAQIISSLGFLPYAVTTAVFPALSRSFHEDRAGNVALVGRSFRFLVSASLPIVAGLAIVAHNLVVSVYGAWFGPAWLNLAILALTLPPVYVATLVNAFIIAADRQVQWTWLMVGVCVINPLLNLVTIPTCQHLIGNGAAGAALALLVTDTLTGVAAIVMLPADLRASVARTAPTIARALLATLLMAAAVWPLRDLFLVVPVAVGAAVFAVAAYVLRVFSREELAQLADLIRRVIPRRRRPRAAAETPDLEGVI